MRYMKGPDSPGGIVVNKDELLNIYETGTGKIRIRGRVQIEKQKEAERACWSSAEIPYTMLGANIGKFLNDVAALVETKRLQSILTFPISLPRKESGSYWN